MAHPIPGKAECAVYGHAEKGRDGSAAARQGSVARCHQPPECGEGGGELFLRPFIIIFFFALESRLLPERGDADETRKAALVRCGSVRTRACPHAFRSGGTGAACLPYVALAGRRCGFPRMPDSSGLGEGPCALDRWAGLCVRGGRAAAAPEGGGKRTSGRGRPLEGHGPVRDGLWGVPMGVAYTAFPAPGRARLILKIRAGESRAAAHTANMPANLSYAGESRVRQHIA